MNSTTMTAKERVFTSLSFKEPDRVPFFLPAGLKMGGEMGLSIKDYFSKSEYVVEGQFKQLEKYDHDVITGFFYSAAEAESFGAEIEFIEDGPPTAGTMILNKLEDIHDLTVPEIKKTPALMKSLKAIKEIKKRVKENYPILGVIISPFSLPVMQLGFEKYLDLLFQQGNFFEMLMEVNKAFEIQWANAQIEAGADIIAFYDPVSSPTIITPELYVEKGFPIAREVIGKIKAPCATHFASGRCLSILDKVIETGSKGVGLSVSESLAQAKSICYGKMSVMGNLDGIKMKNWSEEEIEREVKKTISQGARGGGFVLSDNHGEIPFQVPEKVLYAISEAVKKWGRYPIHSDV